MLGLGSVASATSCTDGAGSQTGEETETDFEYIIIGSGAGGGPLACNLARAGHRVLLLEAGNDQGKLLSQQIPAWHVRSTEEPAMRWDYFVKHYDDDTQARRDSKFVESPGPHHEPGVLYPRAGTLGGCTAHHAMITVYPHQSDWDHIADITGDDSWRADGMRRYFQLIENCQYIDRDDEDEARGHGLNGWLKTTMPDTRIAVTDTKLIRMVAAAAKAFGVTGALDGPLDSIFNSNGALQQLTGLMSRDLNSADPNRDATEGLFGVPQATDGQKRRGPREYILDTIAAGFPLTLRTNTLVSKILFADEPDSDGNLRATGVEIMEGQNLYRASPMSDQNDPELPSTRPELATREVIISCGTFNTPQLLKLSGIGPKAELEAMDPPIKVLKELQGVGTNLQDRYEVGIISELSSDFNAIDDCKFGDSEPDPCLDQWKQGKGPYTTHGAAVSVVMKSSPDVPDPDLIIFGLPSYFKGYEPGYSHDVFGSRNKFTWAILKGHTQNTAGTVTLRSTDPRDVPDIRFKYFHEGTPEGADHDLQAMVRGVQFARTIRDKADDLFLFTRINEIVPGPSVTDIATFVKDEAWGHHASCTCPIGAKDDPNAVLDSKFRVKGTSNLRVVDASVFPRIPGFFIVVPIYMISEKACDEILASIGESRPV